MDDPTKDRLLEAAGEVFAERGFESATIRAIVDRAGANIASVNYHFGDKEHLYEAAVLHAHRCAMENPPRFLEEDSPAEKLRGYIANFLSHVVAIHHTTWHHTLMLREMVAPTRASETLVREAIRPRFDCLREILLELCPGASERRINALAFSVVGQCLHYKLSQPISIRLVGPAGYAELDHEYVSEHITQFTLAALGVVPPFDAAGEPPALEESVGEANSRRGGERE
jgi:AcrR family transcriptional regulator